MEPSQEDSAQRLYERANQAYQQGNDAEAAALCERASALFEQQGEANVASQIECLLLLESIYWHQKKAAEAQAVRSRVLSLSKRESRLLSPAAQEILGMTFTEFKQRERRKVNLLNQHAMSLMHRKKYAKTEVLFKQVLSICEHVPLGDIETAGALNNLGLLAVRRKKYAEAESFYLRSLALREQQTSPDSAQVLNNLALLYVELGRYAEAEPLYEQAVALYEHQEKRDAMVQVLNNFALLYQEQGRYVEAEQLYERASMMCAEPGGIQPATLQTLQWNYRRLRRIQGFLHVKNRLSRFLTTPIGFFRKRGP